MSKFVKYISYLLIGIAAVITVAFFLNKEAMQDTFLFYGYILFGIAVLAAIVMPLFNMLDNPKSFKKILINLLIVVVVVGVAYLLASGDPLQNTNITPEPTANTLKITDTGLILVYILFAISVTAIVAGSVVNMVKNR
jgi:Ca2+/Na+ antiporter